MRHSTYISVDNKEKNNGKANKKGTFELFIKNPSKNTDIGVAWKIFFDSCYNSRLSKRTTNYYKWLLYKFFKDCQEHQNIYDVCDISKMTIVNYMKFLMDTISVSYASHFLTGIKAFYGRLNSEIDDEIPNIPAKVKRPKMPKVIKEAYSDSDIEFILKLFDERKYLDYRNKCMIKTILSTGLRSEELINISPSSINREKNLIHLTVTKGSKDRMVPVDDQTIAMLDEMEIVRGPHPLGKNCPYFIGIDNKPLKVEALKTISKRLNKKICLQSGAKFGWHQLRRKFATDYIRQGGNVVMLKEILGHEDIETTMVYARLSFNDLSDSVKRVDAYKNKFIEK